MYNMIKLDWLGMKCFQKRIVILPLIACVYGLAHEGLVIPLISFLVMSYAINPFAVEEKGSLDNLYLTLPITRKNIVDARFGLSFIIQAVGFLAGIIITVFLSKILYGKSLIGVHTFRADFTVIFILICGSLLFNSILNLSMFPILFRIGYAKGKVIGFYIPTSAVAILALTVYTLFVAVDGFKDWVISMVDWALSNPVPFALVLLAGAVCINALSYVLSRKAYEKRDL